MKANVFLFLLMLPALPVTGQSLSPVIATSGDYFISPVGSLSWTIGELSTETYRVDGHVLTQGFQQPQVMTVTGLKTDQTLSFYPNPVHETLFVKTDERGEYRMEIFNLQGQRVIDLVSQGTAIGSIHSIDVREIRAALYLLRVTYSGNGRSSIHKIEKY